MKINESRKLPSNIDMQCYACDDNPATHVCRYQMDELMVQVCLCVECMKMDTEKLLRNTVGIEKPPDSAAKDFLPL